MENLRSLEIEKKDSPDDEENEKQECAKNSDIEPFDESKSKDRNINIITKSPR